MPRRSAPTSEEVLKLVRPMIPLDRAIKLTEVQERLRRALATTRNHAARWLTTALLSEDSELALVSTTARGAVCRHHLNAEGEEVRSLVEGADWRVTLDMSGHHHGFSDRSRLPAGQSAWVITTDLLVSFAHAEATAASQRQEETKRQRLAQQRASALNAAYLEENHGDALAVLRGLFARAGVLRNHLDRERRTHEQTVRAVCADDPDGTRYALAVMSLRDEEINAVAAVLAELGITPADEPPLTETPPLAAGRD